MGFTVARYSLIKSVYMKLENECRKSVPQLEFKANDTGGHYKNLDLSYILHRDYLLVEYDELKAKALTESFKKPTFEEIVDGVADVLGNNICGEGIYFLRTVGDEIHLRFYICEQGVDEFRDAVGEQSLEVNEPLGYVWVISKAQFNTEKMMKYFTGYCEAIVDLDTLCVWEVKPEHYSIPLKQDFCLPEPRIFKHQDYVVAYDEYKGAEGEFRISSRGLRLYDPVAGEFVRFSRKASAVKTVANTLLFRQSYSSFYYLFEVDLVTAEIKCRHYENAESDLLSKYRDRYGNLGILDFEITGNV